MIDSKLTIHLLPVSGARASSAGSRLTSSWMNNCAVRIAKWIHQHMFHAGDGGTLVRDLVNYPVPFDSVMHG